MKRNILILVLCSCFLFTACTSSEQSSENNDNNQEQVIVNYSWTLTTVWVWPVIWKERDVWENDLVLRWWSEDTLVHLFVPEEIYKKAFSSEEDYLPWTKIAIEWSVSELPWMLGHRYYSLKAAQSMKVVGYPDINEISEILQSYWKCQEDSDCSMIGWISPLECYIPINEKFSKISYDILSSYDTRIWGDKSGRVCEYAAWTMCRFNTCMINYWSDAKVPYYEGPIEEKYALTCPKDLNDCSSEWGPVCSSDWVEYASACEACEAWVSLYVTWKCD